MNPPSPSVPSLTPDLPISVGTGSPVAFEIRNLPAEPTSIEVNITNSVAPADNSAEIVGKTQGASLYNGGASLTTALAYDEGTATFSITSDHLRDVDQYIRVIVVAGDQTFTFE